MTLRIAAFFLVAGSFMTTLAWLADARLADSYKRVQQMRLQQICELQYVEGCDELPAKP